MAYRPDMAAFEVPADLTFNRGAVADPAALAQETDAASWLFLCGDEFAAMEGGISYDQVRAAVPVSENIVSTTPAARHRQGPTARRRPRPTASPDVGHVPRRAPFLGGGLPVLGPPGGRLGRRGARPSRCRRRAVHSQRGAPGLRQAGPPGARRELLDVLGTLLGRDAGKRAQNGARRDGYRR